MKSISICMNCQQTHHFTMLTTYALKGHACDICGTVTDLAIVMDERPIAQREACRCMPNGEDGINWSCPVHAK